MAKSTLAKPLLYLPRHSFRPHDLFYAAPALEVRCSANPTGRRFIRKYMHGRETFGECLIYTDASCYRNGTEDAVGECIVAYEPSISSPEHFNEDTSFMDIAIQESTVLPNHTVYGPWRYAHPTSSRAKLYAAILAVEARPWAREGWGTIVIAVDMDYVVMGITDLVWKWRKNGWRKSNGKPVANVDLWKRLVASIQNLQNQDVSVKFWKVPRVKGN